MSLSTGSRIRRWKDCTTPYAILTWWAIYPWNLIEPKQLRKFNYRHKDPKCEVIRSFISEDNEDLIITRQVTVKSQQRESIISALLYQHFAARITVGSFSSSQRLGLVTISGKIRDVEQALRGIETIISDEQRLPSWVIDETYIESVNMDQKVRCVHANGTKNHTPSLIEKKTLEFILDRERETEISHDISYACGGNSLFNVRMKDQFEKAMIGLGAGCNVQIQARLGRVVFASSGVFEKSLPFLDGQAKPLGELRKYFDRHQITKRRFDDTIPYKEFYYLRAGLHLCSPITVERQNNFIFVVSNPRARDKVDREGKFNITEAIDVPGRFHLQRVERKTRLAVADIVRLNTGAMQVYVRLSMQEGLNLNLSCFMRIMIVHENEVDHEGSVEAQDFVRKMRRKGAKLEFPSEPYVVHVQRDKDSEIFWFDDLKVALMTVTQIRGGVPRSKYEVEFKAIQSRSEVGREEMTVPLSELTSKIQDIVKHVQSMCCQMSLTGPSSTAIGVVQALLRSWKMDHNETLIKGILLREFFPSPLKGEVVGGDQDQVSMQICNLIELLCHCDSQILPKGFDIAAELQLVLLHIIHSMNISLAKSMAGRVKWLLANHRLEPETALKYASLLKCSCSPLDVTWNSVIRPYIMQLILENQSDILEKFLLQVNLCNEILHYSSL